MEMVGNDEEMNCKGLKSTKMRNIGGKGEKY